MGGEFDADCPALDCMSRREDRAAARERVEHQVAGLDRALEQLDVGLDGFLGAVAQVGLGHPGLEGIVLDRVDRALALDGVEAEFVGAAGAMLGPRHAATFGLDVDQRRAESPPARGPALCANPGEQVNITPEVEVGLRLGQAEQLRDHGGEEFLGRVRIVGVEVVDARHLARGVSKLVRSHAIRRVCQDHVELSVGLRGHPLDAVGLVGREAVGDRGLPDEG